MELIIYEQDDRRKIMFMKMGSCCRVDSNYMKDLGKDCSITKLGLNVEKPKFFISWDITEKAIHTVDKNISQIDKSVYSVHQVLITDFPFIDRFTICFEKNKLKRLDLGIKEELYGSSTEEVSRFFFERQKNLEQHLGKPLHNSFLRSFFKVNKDDIEYRWKLKNAVVVHQLWDRFGIEENLFIVIV